MAKVLVVGASGYIGSAVVRTLKELGHVPIAHTAPRISAQPRSVEDFPELRNAISQCHAVVNAAGIPDATANDAKSMHFANAVLPTLIAKISENYGVRFIHVSSAAVQGRKKCLDSTPHVEPFSPYSTSKARAETGLAPYAHTVIYRPPGVHGPNRRVTKSIQKLARSPLSTVAGPGTANTPQAHIDNVADAIAFLATTPLEPPTIVAHPSEGVTVSTLLETLGGRKPRTINPKVAHLAVNALFHAAKIRQSLAGTARRLEILWFGQGQASSWLTEAGWKPRISLQDWP